MKVLVIGAGAVGSFLGATLAAAGHEVSLLRRRTLETHRERLTVRDATAGDRTFEVTSVASAADMVPAPDLVVVAVKMPDLPGALDVAAAWPDSTLLAVQNGVGADDMVVRMRTRGAVVAGSLTASVALEDGDVRRLSRGGIGLATVRGGVNADGAPNADVERLVAAFTAGGLRARHYPDARAMRWSKLLANLLANATSAILDVDPAAVYDDPALFAVERRQLQEALGVMRVLGLRPVRLPGADVRLLAPATRLPAGLIRPVMRRVVAAGRGGKSPSLRGHVASGAGPSEVEWLNGAVADAAARLGRRAPVNARLAALVDACSEDAQRRAWFRQRPDRLLEALAGP